MNITIYIVVQIMSNSSNISYSNDTDIILAETTVISNRDPAIPVAGIFVIVSCIYFLIVCIAVTGNIHFPKNKHSIKGFSAQKRSLGVSFANIKRILQRRLCLPQSELQLLLQM